MGKWNSPNPSVRVVFLFLGHLKWTIFTLLRQFCFLIFPMFAPSYWRPILITPESGRLKIGKWDSHNLNVRVVFLGHSNWTICTLLTQIVRLGFQPVEPILSLSELNFTFSQKGTSTIIDEQVRLPTEICLRRNQVRRGSSRAMRYVHAGIEVAQKCSVSNGAQAD